MDTVTNPENEAKAAALRAQSLAGDSKPEGTAESLARCANMLNVYSPECFPANEYGQVHFVRAMMESVADEIRAFLAHTARASEGIHIPDGYYFKDDLDGGRLVKNPSFKLPITVAWLHSLNESGWKPETRGISCDNWTIHSIQSRPRNVPVDEWSYDAGPFVWTVSPTHVANMMPLKEPGKSNFAILVLESQKDVLRLLRLLRREQADKQSCDDLAASGGIVEAP